MKKFEVTVEVLEQYEVTVYAEDFADALERAKSFPKNYIREGCLIDGETRVIGVSRSKESRMYR